MWLDLMEQRWPVKADWAKFTDELELGVYEQGALLFFDPDPYNDSGSVSLSVEQLRELGNVCLAYAAVLERRAS